jgi:hypothetical protein
MDLLVADADKEGVVLWLEPSAYGNKFFGGLTQDELIGWYERHGFRWADGEQAGAMYREPLNP